MGPQKPSAPVWFPIADTWPVGFRILKVKPGNKMPPTYLTPRELHVLVLYLESLE